MKFHRVFSKSMYKDLRLPLAEMTFSKDFIHTDRGDLYPVVERSADCVETVENNRYFVRRGTVERMFSQFFPYASYEVTFSTDGGRCGFSFRLPSKRAQILCGDHTLSFRDAEGITELPIQTADKITLLVSCRPGAFDVYFYRNGQPQFFHTFKSDRFTQSNRQTVFQSSFVSLLVEGNATVEAVSSCIDCGISQADIRPVHYENGDTLYENGKAYFTASIRIQEGGFQGVFAWTPTTSRIELTGALFFDRGDGFWRNYLASALLYHREKKEWYIWTSAFEHTHILCHAAFPGDPRFGVNVIDVTPMDAATGEDPTAFAGFRGDEDPDFYYNEAERQWYMAICRICPETHRYRYCFFRSREPFSGYTYIGRGYPGEETGGSFVKIDGQIAFVCGNSFDKRSNYRIYTKNGMEEAGFDFPDGGFRGWGGVISLNLGSRNRFFWLTFDRHNGSSYNWSYGNIYCFEGML